MACLGNSMCRSSAILSPLPSSPNPKFSPSSLKFSSQIFDRSLSFRCDLFAIRRHSWNVSSPNPCFNPNFMVIASADNSRPLRIMISGAPASGKGTQCELIIAKVPEELLVERVVGRRLDPVTGRIYHLKYSPPENNEIAARLTQRFDDTEEKVKLRLQTYHQNVEAVLSMYEEIIVKVDGSTSKDDVFAQIDKALSKHVEENSASQALAV